MKTIKIIDLLNKIANGEDVPKKIKVHNTEYHKCLLNTGVDYKIYSDDFYYLSNEICKAGFSLNDEVEIIEEEKKLPEKLEEIGNIDYNLGYIDYKNIEVLKTWLNSDMQTIFNELDLIVKNQNQLIDYLESKEKGE